ncbi:MAG: PKD domain-containing protein [Planctomycetota bacterium]
MSLVEATLSIMIVGTMLVAALNTVGAARMTRQRMCAQNLGTLLAQDLMSEILAQDYADADYGPDSFGLGADEIGDGSRALFEDVDDYDNWSASPPQYQDGTEISGLDDWGRSVEVDWVSSDNLSLTLFSNEGAKRVTVYVKQNGQLAATLVAVRTQAYVEVEDSGGGGGDGGSITSGNKPPTAVIDAIPTEGLAPLLVTFFAGSSSDPDGDSLSYDWDFDDGDTGSGSTVLHIFSAGQYTATLTASDGKGGTDKATVFINVK